MFVPVTLIVAAVAQAVGAIEGAKDLPTLADECEKKGTSVTEDEGEEEEGGEEEEEQVTQAGAKAGAETTRSATI